MTDQATVEKHNELVDRGRFKTSVKVLSNFAGASSQYKDAKDIVHKDVSRKQTSVSLEDNERYTMRVDGTLNAKTLNIDTQSGNLPCHVFYLNDQQTLQRFRTFDQLSDYLVSAAVDKSVTSTDLKHECQAILQLPITTASHHATVGQYLAHLYENDRLMDVLIDVKGTVFNAHRIALCCYSEYFARLFLGKPITKIPFELKVNGINPGAFAAFLEFCYTGELNVTPETSIEILIVVDFLNVTALKSRLGKVYEQIPLQEALKLLLLKKERSGVFFLSMYSQVQSQFTAASKLDMFLDMDLELLCQFLSSDYLAVTSEYELFSIAVRWILHDMDRRLRHTVTIMQLIRFCNMSQEELVRCADRTSVIRGYDVFRERVLAAQWILACRRLDRQDPFNFPLAPPRKYGSPSCECQTTKASPVRTTRIDDTCQLSPPIMTSTPRVEMVSPETVSEDPGALDILVVGGFVTDDNSTDDPTEDPKFIERYDTADNQWVHFCKLPAPRRHHAVVSSGQNLYLIGGTDPTSTAKVPIPTKTVFRLDLTTKEWNNVANMNDARYRHCACAKDNKIYVVGGKSDGETILRSVECYDEDTEGWYYLVPMAMPRFGAMVACVDDRIIVAGGIGDSQEVPSTLHVLKSVSCFHRGTKSWTSLCDLRIPRCLGTLVSVNERLFLCGGATRSYNFKNSVLSSVASIDEYDFERNGWNHVTDLLVPRHDMGVAVVGDRIYMIGGVSSVGEKDLQSVECYETGTSTWIQDIQDLPFAARWICCTVVKPRHFRPKGTLPNFT